MTSRMVRIHSHIRACTATRTGTATRARTYERARPHEDEYALTLAHTTRSYMHTLAHRNVNTVSGRAGSRY